MGMSSKAKTAETSEKVKDSAVRIKDTYQRQRGPNGAKHGACRRQRRPAHRACCRPHHLRCRTDLCCVGTHGSIRDGQWYRCEGITDGYRPWLARSHNRERAYAIQRVLFRRGGLASPLSRTTSAAARCRAHSSGRANIGERISSLRIHRGVSWHLVRIHALRCLLSGVKRTWAFVDVCFCGRYWGRSGYELVRRTLPLMTQSGHQSLLIGRRWPELRYLWSS